METETKNTKTMTYDNFKKNIYDPAMKGKEWNFDLFKIKCNKCGSEKVEFRGACESEAGYYEGEHSVKYGGIIVKCHSCGNAMVVKIDRDSLMDDENDFISGLYGVKPNKFEIG